jgi:serine protease Do
LKDLKRIMSNKRLEKSSSKPAVLSSRFLLLPAIVLSLAASVSFAQSHTRDTATSPVTSAATSSTAPAVAFSYAEVVDRVSPAVVTIRSEKRVRAPKQFPFSNDPFLERFFGNPQGRGRGGEEQPQADRRASALGSGVIVSRDGYILTNHHVVDGAQQIKVELSDNRTVDAKVVGSDPPSDLAVLKVDAGSLPVLPMGDSDKVRVGDVALAVGNPLGVGKTVTMGIISAKGRQTGLSNGSFEDFLQTDAPINQGNSGGALVSTNGELIGINSQILSGTGGSIGIGFAVPTNMAKSVMDQLISTGKVRRGQLGIVVQKVSSEIASSLRLADTRGVIVSQVQPGSAADRAGVRQGDVITTLNGVVVNDPNTFRNSVASAQPGADVSMTVLRDGREQQVRAKLGEFTPEKADDESEASSTGPANKNNATGQLGVGVQPLTPQLSQQLGLPAGTQGLVVGEVEDGGPASEAGIQQGDVIVSVNQQPVRSITDLRGALQKSATRPALLLINRRGTTIFVTVKPRA